MDDINSALTLGTVVIDAFRLDACGNCNFIIGA
jgi:hypothetical protein